MWLGGGGITVQSSAWLGGGGIGELESSLWLGGGGIGELESSLWLGGGGIAVQSSAWLGGGGIAVQSSARLGGGGIGEHDTSLASDSILLCCAVPGPGVQPQIPPASSEVHTTTRVRSPRNRSRANSSGSPDRA